MFINEDRNNEANKAVQMVSKYVAENPSFGFSVDVTQVDGNRKQPKEFLKKCK